MLVGRNAEHYQSGVGSPVFGCPLKPRWQPLKVNNSPLQFLGKNKIRVALFYESNQSMSRGDFKHGYWQVIYYLKHALPFNKLVEKRSTLVCVSWLLLQFVCGQFYSGLLAVSSNLAGCLRLTFFQRVQQYKLIFKLVSFLQFDSLTHKNDHLKKLLELCSIAWKITYRFILFYCGVVFFASVCLVVAKSPVV